MATETPAARAIPTIAVILAVGYLAAAMFAARFLPLIIAAAAVAACALVRVRRRDRGLRASLLVIALWLAAGFVGAWLLRGSSLAGAAWVVAALFAAPLPLIPWLYARTFGIADGKREDGA